MCIYRSMSKQFVKKMTRRQKRLEECINADKISKSPEDHVSFKINKIFRKASLITNLSKH